MSYKTEVIERLFFERWNLEAQVLSSSVVTLIDVQRGITKYNQSHGTSHSDRNPANFAKDFWRKHSSANRNWPRAVLEAGYTGRQYQFGGNSFEFVPLNQGQSDAVDAKYVPRYDERTRRVEIESVSLPLASKRLGRSDEPWLIQVLIRLRVFETHLALSSNRKVVQLDHLQTNVKLRGAEIDALFLAVLEGPEGQPSEAIVCCEAKSRRDDIVPHQILNGVRAVFNMNIQQDVVIPIAVKAIAPSQIFIIEFEAIERSRAKENSVLKEETSAIYILKPPVPGIGR